MIDRSVNNFEETHDKLAFNDFDESHLMFAYLYSDRPNASFVQAISAKYGCGTPQTAREQASFNRLAYSLPSHSSIVPSLAARYGSND